MKVNSKVMKDALERTSTLLLEASKKEDESLKETVASIFSALLLLSVDLVDAVGEGVPSVMIYHLNPEEQDEGYAEAPDEVHVLADGRASVRWYGDEDEEEDRTKIFETFQEIIVEFGPAVFNKADRWYRWTVEIDVHKTWVEDGFNLTDERLAGMLGRELSHAKSNEYDGTVIAAPPQNVLDVETGKTKGPEA